MKIDLAALGKQTFADLRVALAPALAAGSDDAKKLGLLVAEFEFDSMKLMSKLHEATDPVIVAELRYSITLELPARRAALAAAASAIAGSASRASFDAALDVAMKILVGVAKAFIL